MWIHAEYKFVPESFIAKYSILFKAKEGKTFQGTNCKFIERHCAR